MDKEKFVKFTSFFQGIDTIRNQFSSYTALINAANSIIEYYKDSHCKNMFGGIDDECISINPDSGEVKVVSTNNDISMKYKAPELITGKIQNENIDTDNFTLAVILFRLFFIDHPFEGENSLARSPLLSKKISEMLYGYEAVFVYDPNNDSNRPLSNLSPYLKSRWLKVPQSLRDAFISIFTDGMLNPKKRFSTEQWKILINSVADTGVFIDGHLRLINIDDNNTIPLECVIIKINDRKLALSDGGKLIISGGKTVVVLSAEVYMKNGLKTLVLKNATKDTWIIYKSDGGESYVQPNEKAFLYSKDCIDFGSEVGQII